MLRWEMPNSSLAPALWNGRAFVTAGEEFRIFRYPVSAEGWDSELADLMFSENDSERPIGIASRKHAVEQIKKYMPAGGIKSILEVGCTTGLMIDVLQKEFPGALIAGTDVEYDSLLAIAEKYPSVPLFHMDLAEACVPDNKFNCVVSLNVLEHIRDDKAALKNIVKLLEKDGMLVLELPAGASLYDVFDKRLKHFRRYDMGSLLDLLKHSGLQVLEKSHLGFLPYPLFWAKKKLNRRFLNADEIIQNRISDGYLHQTKRSKLLRLMFMVEERLRKLVYLPVGIRCLVTCRKIS